MKLRNLSLLVALTALCPLAPVGKAAAEDLSAKQSSAAGQRQIMVMLDLGAEHYRPGADYGGAYGNAMGEKARLRLARSIAREHGLTLVESWPMELIGVDCVVMAINDGRSVDAVMAELKAVRGVSWTQALNEFRVQGSSERSYNDRLYRAQPSSQSWNLASLHRVSTGRGVTIAIVDSRIDTRHPDLVGQIASAQDFVAKGRVFPERHGTGIAGIIAARPGNSVGIAGVAPGAKVLGLRACWERSPGGATVCDSLSLAKALNFAIRNRADVLNMSLTGPRDRLLQTLIGLGLSRGMTVVAAVDESNPDASFPATIAGVIPVADERLSARWRGVYIAPGLDVPTTEPNGNYGLVSGSSYAAAHVSGLAALVRQLSGGRSARPLGTAWLGPRGTINACAAIARVSSLNERSCQTHD